MWQGPFSTIWRSWLLHNIPIYKRLRGYEPLSLWAFVARSLRGYEPSWLWAFVAMSLRSWRRALWWRARCEWGCTRLDTTNCACTQQDRVAVAVSAPWWKEIARIHHRMVRLPSWEGLRLLLHRLLYCVWCQPRRAFEVCARRAENNIFVRISRTNY